MELGSWANGDLVPVCRGRGRPGSSILVGQLAYMQVQVYRKFSSSRKHGAPCSPGSNPWEISPRSSWVISGPAARLPQSPRNGRGGREHLSAAAPAPGILDLPQGLKSMKYEAVRKLGRNQLKLPNTPEVTVDDGNLDSELGWALENVLWLFFKSQHCSLIICSPLINILYLKGWLNRVWVTWAFFPHLLAYPLPILSIRDACSHPWGLWLHEQPWEDMWDEGAA